MHRLGIWAHYQWRLICRICGQGPERYPRIVCCMRFRRSGFSPLLLLIRPWGCQHLLPYESVGEDCPAIQHPSQYRCVPLPPRLNTASMEPLTRQRQASTRLSVCFDLGLRSLGLTAGGCSDKYHLARAGVVEAAVFR
eukprot:05756_6